MYNVLNMCSFLRRIELVVYKQYFLNTPYKSLFFGMTLARNVHCANKNKFYHSNKDNLSEQHQCKNGKNQI